MTTYTFHHDAGHGWLEVPALELVRLGIEMEITQFSYIFGDRVYLEEDCDAPAFIKAKADNAESFGYRRRYRGNNASIRKLRNFKPAFIPGI